MKSILQSVILCIGMVLLTATCEIEKTEYKNTIDDDSFSGFSSGSFILHSQSISYYSPLENKVFSDLYFHQNGVKTKNGIHSMISFGYVGAITFQQDNAIEFMDMVNFKSLGFLELENPRNINSGYPYCLVSFGDRETGGIAMIDIHAKEIVNTIRIGTETGKIFVDDQHIYVFCDGNNADDSVMYRLYRAGYTPASLHKLDSFVIGIRPVDGVGMSVNYPEYEHKGLAVLCKGNATIPASIVLLDLVTGKIAGSYPFESTALEPESLFWLYNYDNQPRILGSLINNKLYSLTLNNPVEKSLLIDKNIRSLIQSGNYYTGVSSDTAGTTTSLYRFDPYTLELVDSLVIDGKATGFSGPLF
jgi:hypothetical protein